MLGLSEIENKTSPVLHGGAEGDLGVRGVVDADDPGRGVGVHGVSAGVGCGGRARVLVC